MSRSSRMFEIIQMLRSAKAPLTAEQIADALEVTKRTIYRDMATLQAMRVPIEGEAGVGYIMRPGFDLPPLMFTSEEVEVIVVGLALLGRTGDTALLKAASSLSQKISSVLPDDFKHEIGNWPLYASGWNRIPQSQVDPQMLRRAIREEEKIRFAYVDGDGKRTRRTVLPIAIFYYIEAVVLAAWCELRSDFRHFRLDRLSDCRPTGARFEGQAQELRAKWERLHRLQ